MMAGIVSSPCSSLTVYPAIFAIWKGRRIGEGTSPTVAA